MLAAPAANLLKMRLDQLRLAWCQGHPRPQDHLATPLWSLKSRLAVAERRLSDGDLDLGAVRAKERDGGGNRSHLAAMRSSIRPDRATDVPRDGEGKLEPGEPRLGGNSRRLCHGET